MFCFLQEVLVPIKANVTVETNDDSGLQNSWLHVCLCGYLWMLQKFKAYIKAWKSTWFSSRNFFNDANFKIYKDNLPVSGKKNITCWWGFSRLLALSKSTWMHILNLKICDGSPTSIFFQITMILNKCRNLVIKSYLSRKVLHCIYLVIYIFLFFVTTIFASQVSGLLTLVRVSEPDTWLAKMRLLWDIYYM